MSKKNDFLEGSAWDKWHRAGQGFARHAGEVDYDTLENVAEEYFENNVDLTGDNARHATIRAFRQGYCSIANDPVLGWQR